MQTPTTLVLGASPNPDRYSFLATNLLQQKGFIVYPFGVKNGQIGNMPIINEWPKKGTIDTVTLYVGPSGQVDYYDAIVALAPRRIIFNPGTENPDLQSIAKANGIETIEACTLVMLTTGQY